MTRRPVTWDGDLGDDLGGDDVHAERLDDLIDALTELRPALDDVTRARVATRLAALPAHAPASPRRRFALGIVGAGSALAAVAAVILLLVARRPPPLPGPATDAADVAAQVRVPVSLPANLPRWVPAGASLSITVEEAAVTVVGPGWVQRRGRVVSVDAAAVLVDRQVEEPALELRYRGARMIVASATFGVDDDAARPRVHVMRGQVDLECGDQHQQIEAAGTAACDPVPAARSLIVHLDQPPVAALVQEPGTIRAPVSTDPGSSAPRTSHRPRGRGAAPPTPAIALARPGLADDPATTPTAADLYARAEERMRHKDAAGAQALLRQVIATAGDGPEGAPALLDLAWLAARQGQDADALRWLDRLALHPAAASLGEPAAHLRCMVAVTSRAASARSCLEAFRHVYPRSPLDPEVLAHLAVLVAASDCASARPLLAEYLARYPSGPHRATLVGWRTRCEGGRGSEAGQ